LTAETGLIPLHAGTTNRAPGTDDWSKMKMMMVFLITEKCVSAHPSPILTTFSPY